MQSQLYKVPLRFHSELAGGLPVAFVNFVIGSLEIEFFTVACLAWLQLSTPQAATALCVKVVRMIDGTCRLFG